MYIKHIVHILYIMIFLVFFPGAGHSDRVIVFKSAAYYALSKDLTSDLSDEDLSEILICESEPVLKAYIIGLFRAACRLWKFVMPVEAKAVSRSQADVFHPASVSPKLQSSRGQLQVYQLTPAGNRSAERALWEGKGRAGGVYSFTHSYGWRGAHTGRRLGDWRLGAASGAGPAAC